MVSPGAIDHVNERIDLIEKEGGRGEGTTEEEMLPVWAQELRERGYEVDVDWERKPWGVVTHVIGTKGNGRVRAMYNPKPPSWVGEVQPGRRSLWIEQDSVIGNKINIIVLVRQIRKDWSLKEAIACAEGKTPLLENVDVATQGRVMRYLGLVRGQVSYGEVE